MAYATYVYSVMTHMATAYSPFELLYGHRARIPSALQEQPTPMYNYEDYVNELRGREKALSSGRVIVILDGT